MSQAQSTYIDETRFRGYLVRSLPDVIEGEPNVKRMIYRVCYGLFPDKEQTEDWFNKILEDLRKDREENNKKWLEVSNDLHEHIKQNEEQFAEMKEQFAKSNARFAKSDERFEEMQKKSDERFAKSDEQFEEMQKKSDERFAKMDERFAISDERFAISDERFAKMDERFAKMDERFAKSDERFAKSDERFEEMQKKSDERFAKMDERFAISDERFAAMISELRDMDSRHKSSIGALGARWGIAAESSFRKALKSILEDRFDVKVINFNDFDEEGFVHGEPDQVELDVIIKNGDIIACEIKSSMSRSDMSTFYRKVQFYEKKNHCHVSTRMVISPMVDKYAMNYAERHEIEVHSYVEDVPL